jgi:uncharacterized protein (TIGR02270 family)
MSAAVISHIVEQHAEEAAFLWILRSYAVHAPHYRLKDLAKLDNRVEAHLDGLRISGSDGWDLCEQALEIGEAGEMFAAGLLALESKDPHKLANVIGIAENTPEAVNGLISALGWTEPSKLSGTVKQLLESKSSFQQLLGISACAIHRVNPGPVLSQLIKDPATPLPLRSRALRTAGELKCRDLIYPIQDCFQDEAPLIRFWAAWSAVLLGNRSQALEILKTFTVTPAGQFPSPLPMLLRAMSIENATNLLKGLAQYPERQRDLVAGAGMIGDPFYIPWLIKQMHTPELARLAGESFSFITGVDIAYEDLDANRPEGFESGPSEDPADSNVALDSDEDLPWPDPTKIQAWWSAKQQQFQIGQRYLLGAPIIEAQCRKVLREGFQRQRAAATLELALMKPDEVLFEVRAPGWRQQRLLQNSI